jgi:hypothetical protein
MRPSLWLLAGAAFLAAAGPACQSGLKDPSPLPATLDEAYFRCKVQPILTRSCAAYACHGSSDRYFKLFGRNRLRIGGTIATLNAPMTAAERAWNYDAARAQVDLASPAASYLLLKPLAAAAGGYYHGATTLFAKQNVFLDALDSDYLILEKWIHGEKAEDQACIEPGSDL